MQSYNLADSFCTVHWRTIQTWLHLKALVFLYAFEESVDCHLLSSFCDDSNLHISLFKYVLSTMGVSKESISKFLIGNRFHVKLRIFSPENCNFRRNFTWNRFPIKNLLFDSLLTPIVESTYSNLTSHDSFWEKGSPRSCGKFPLIHWYP